MLLKTNSKCDENDKIIEVTVKVIQGSDRIYIHVGCHLCIAI